MCVFNDDFVRKLFPQFACGHSNALTSLCIAMCVFSEYREVNPLLHVGHTKHFFRF